METKVGASIFRSEFIDENRDGYAVFNLYKERFGESFLTATVMCWPSTGQCTLRTHIDLPVEIAEELIAEVKSKIKN